MMAEKPDTLDYEPQLAARVELHIECPRDPTPLLWSFSVKPSPQELAGMEETLLIEAAVTQSRGLSSVPHSPAGLSCPVKRSRHDEHYGGGTQQEATNEQFSCRPFLNYISEPICISAAECVEQPRGLWPVLT
ncbi:hypothetical protein DPX16_5180 [Anabarilius grahami]|uniref:Uncharacterized protein n=1 Tax=Anabarilius grahami TaxID=495550 RepID=A0A3N0XL44_ANAGA|nr:hypothetical protein DPX16_5180 [Anabarilius grahami]